MDTSGDPKQDGNLLEKLRNSRGHFKVESMGSVVKTVRFRGLWLNVLWEENGTD